MIDDRSMDTAVQPAPSGTEAPWDDVVLVCLACARKIDGGTGPDGRSALRRELKTRLAEDRREKMVRVVETSCLGLCPDGAVSVALGQGVAPGRPRVYALRPGDDLDAICRHFTAAPG